MRWMVCLLLAVVLAGCTDDRSDHDDHDHDDHDDHGHEHDDHGHDHGTGETHFHVAYNEDNGATTTWNTQRSTATNGATVPAGQGFTLAFNANGPGPADLSIRYGQQSVPDAEVDEEAYPEQTDKQDAVALPTTHDVTLTIDTPGTYHFRGFAIDGREGTVTPQWTFTVV